MDLRLAIGSPPQPRCAKIVLLLRLLAAFVCLIPVAARAHGRPPLPLALWGPFARTTIQCMRPISCAAQRCFRAVVAAERACMDAELTGGTCDVPRRDAEIASARSTAESVVAAACLGGQLTELRFADFNDARADILRACAHADGTVELLYGPLTAAPSVDAIPADERHCIVQTAAMSAKYLEVIMRAKTAVLDHAASIIAPSQKLGLLSKANDRIAAARTTLATQLGQACPGFADTYGLAPADFLSALELRADCVLGIMYVQTAISCQLPFCGNGITEPGEQCDDANANDNDTCHTNCTSNQSVSSTSEPVR